MHRDISTARLTHYGAKLKTFSKVAAAFLAIACAALLAAPADSQTPSMSMTLETTTGADKVTVVPRLTWATTPPAPGCTAGGDWSGAKTASGTQLLAAVNASKAYSLVCNWPGVTLAVINWTPPTTNTDGSALTDLAGYRIQYGRGSTEAALDQSVYISSPAAATWTSPALAAGAWFFGVKAFNSLGLESALSNVASKTMTAAATDSRSLVLGVKFPAPPTGVN